MQQFRAKTVHAHELVNNSKTMLQKRLMIKNEGIVLFQEAHNNMIGLQSTLPVSSYFFFILLFLGQNVTRISSSKCFVLLQYQLGCMHAENLVHKAQPGHYC